jgi:hypothetical protein
MSNGKFLFALDGKANSDLSAKRGYWIKPTSTADVYDLNDSKSTLCLGVLMNDPASGQTAQVQVLGVATAWADGTTAISIGDRVGSNDSGVTVKKATADYNAGGIALDALASGTGFIRVLLTPGEVFRTLGG